MPRRLHLRGQADALHPPRRVRRLRGVRAGLPGRGDLLRGRHPGAVEGVLHRERGVLQRPGLAGRCREDGRDREGPPAGGRAAAPGRRVTVPHDDHDDHDDPYDPDTVDLVPPPGEPRWAARSVSGRLPDFPWDRLLPMAERARAHADGIVDLSVGTPVDPTPAVVQAALRAATDAP